MSLKAFYTRLPLSLLICLLLAFAGSPALHAQSRFNTDSAARARTQALEIARSAQKHSLDSTRAARQHALDSMKAARKVVTDSLTALRKYRESRSFRDSVTEARAERIAAIRDAQRARLDSVKDARQRVSDSVVGSREAATAAVRKYQQRRTDSLTAAKAYRISKRYADSVAIVRRVRTDSLQAARKAFTDSVSTARQIAMATVKTMRKLKTDSLNTARKHRTDSLAVVKKAKDAAVAKAKDNKSRDKKIKDKQAENKMQLAVQLKINSKRKKYTNETMLKKKWSAPRQVVQNTFTRFNYYFNADRKMDEAEANMQRAPRDKWEDRIALFPFNAATDSTTFASDMDSVIQKASLGIQIHDPRTKWGDDLYLLMGKAYYYKGDLENATASFKYIVAIQEKLKAEAAKKAANRNKPVRKSKEAPSFVTPEDNSMLEFLKHQPANNDALLWLVRAYTEYGHYNEAESILDLLTSDSKFPESLRGRLALEQGYLAIKEHNDKQAATHLAIVSADKSIPVYTRRRAAYLNGQLLQDAGDYAGAAKQYAYVSELNPKIDMDFYARRNRAYALMQSGGVQKDAIASLKSMLGDGKFAPYYEQVYYVLGRLSANSGDNAGAVAYLQKGIGVPKTTRRQKALSFAAMGNIYFNTGEYTAAKIAYDSASRFAPAAPDDSGVAIAMRRSAVVDKIAAPSLVIHQQDSLLTLGSLSEKEQRAAVRRYIRTLQARKSDSAFRAENGGVAAAAVTDNSATSGDASALTWYFANPALIQQGITEFKRKWGNRPLGDNWRRASASGGNGIPGPPTGSDATAGIDNGVPAGGLDENGLPTEEALLAYIPTTPEARAVATGRLQRAYVDMGTAYLRQFEDYPRAGAMLDTLDKRWQLNPYTAEATYLRYLIALRRNNLKEAQVWSQKLQRDFAGTQWAGYVAPAPGDAEASGPPTATLSDYYDATYDLLQQHQYGEVLSRTRAARRQYTDEAYGSRFRIVEAMAFAGSAQYSQADSILNDFIHTHSGDPLKPWAEQVLSYVTERRKTDTLKQPAPVPASLTAPGSSTASATPGTPAASGPIGIRAADTSSLPVPADYTYKPQEAHYFVFAVNKIEARTMGVKAGLGDLNTFRFASAGLDVGVVPMKSSRGIIVVKPFKNAAAARTYLSSFNDAKMLVREYQANEYQTFIISAANYRKLVSDGSISSYLPFYRGHY